MACAVTVVITFGAKQKSIQSLVLPDRVKTTASSRQKLVDIALVADVKNQFILWRAENAMQGDGQLHDPEIGPEMPADLRKNRDQFIPYLLRKLRESSFLKALKVRRAN